MKKFSELNENENITCRNLWESTRLVLRGTFIALNTVDKGKVSTQ